MQTIDGKTKSYEDLSFTSGDSPRVIDFYADTGREAISGYVANDGLGALQVEISFDGSTYSDAHTLYAGEILEFEYQSVNKLRLTHVADTKYRVHLL
jgi:hypothetical protein